VSRISERKKLAMLTDSLAQLAGILQGPCEAEAAELIKTGDSEPDAVLMPTTLAAWTMLCNEMMNLDEVLNK
jgi:hypothetical protein